MRNEILFAKDRKNKIKGQKNMENLFEKLMEQIKMPPNLRRSSQFEHADIENVEVHTASKLWHFQLIFDEILPIDTYKLLTELSVTFYLFHEFIIKLTHIAFKIKDFVSNFYCCYVTRML